MSPLCRMRLGARSFASLASRTLSMPDSPRMRVASWTHTQCSPPCISDLMLGSTLSWRHRSAPSGAAFLTARAVDSSPPGMGHVGCATDEPRCCSSGQAVCATCWGDNAVHAERYLLKEPGRQAKRSTTTKATIVFRIPDPPNASYMFKLGQRCGETVCNMLGLRSEGMLFVVTRRELCYLNVEIKNLA